MAISDWRKTEPTGAQGGYFSACAAHCARRIVMQHQAGAGELASRVGLSKLDKFSGVNVDHGRKDQ
jgi:hypothetical protein